MARQLDDVLSGAALNETEQRVVERLVAHLREQLGDDLLAVWLYGSRARREADPSETDPDLRSDIDLIAIVGPGRGANDVAWEIQPQLEAIADAEGDSPVYYSLRFYDAEFLGERRSIRDFFFQEVDRDKLILHGDGLPAYRGASEGGGFFEPALGGAHRLDALRRPRDALRGRGERPHAARHLERVPDQIRDHRRLRRRPLHPGAARPGRA